MTSTGLRGVGPLVRAASGLRCGSAGAAGRPCARTYTAHARGPDILGLVSAASGTQSPMDTEGRLGFVGVRSHVQISDGTGVGALTPRGSGVNCVSRLSKTKPWT